jgi:hypothetical protein
LVLVGLKQQQAQIRLQVHQVATLFFPQSLLQVAVVVVVLVLVLVQRLVVLVVVVLVLLVVLLVVQETRLQLPRHKVATVVQVQAMKQLIVPVVVAVVQPLLVGTEAHLLAVQAATVELAQPPQ